jgi:hypothetical protein
MARSLLLAATAAWITAGVAGAVVGSVGAATLQRLLPPLGIDLDALRGAVTAVSLGILGIGVAHAVVVVGLRRGGRRALSAALLLSGFLSVLLVALAAAAATSAATTPANALVFLAAGLAALGGAIGYGLVGSLLVRELRTGSVT